MNKKYNKTAYTFLLCFKYMLKQRIFKIDDIVEYLWTEYSVSVCAETILKYIRTLKQEKVQFNKLNNKLYELKELPVNINFTEDEREILFKSTELKDFYIAQNSDIFKKLVNKLSIFLKNNKTDFYKNLSTYNIADKLKQYCEDNQRLKIIYLKDNKNITSLFEPKELVIIKKIIYLRGYDVTNKANTLINITAIIDLKQTPVKNKTNFQEQYVIIKFLNKCINNYLLKDGKEIISKTQDELLVKSFYYDKELFFKNILRYMDNCEITEPENLRQEFKSYLQKLYRMYD